VSDHFTITMQSHSYSLSFHLLMIKFSCHKKSFEQKSNSPLERKIYRVCQNILAMTTYRTMICLFAKTNNTHTQLPKKGVSSSIIQLGKRNRSDNENNSKIFSFLSNFFPHSPYPTPYFCVCFSPHFPQWLFKPIRLKMKCSSLCRVPFVCGDSRFAFEISPMLHAYKSHGWVLLLPPLLFLGEKKRKKKKVALNI